jgi:subtilisin family serine protease
MFDLQSLNQNVFTWQTALSLAMASDLAYQPGQAVVNVATRNWRLDECRFLAQSDTECFVARTDTAIIVAFRGTESLNDWLADLSVWPTTRPYGKVHGGFVEAFRVISGQLIDTLRSFQPGGKTIHLTGHSLGAALATIAACELHGQFPIAGIYSFGQPRLGDRTTAAFFEAEYPRRFQRFVFDDDIVTRIPPGYRHVGRLFHFDSNGFLQQAPTESTGGGTTELPELTPSQFESMQDTAKAIRTQAVAATAGVGEAADELADRSLEGILPSVSDHRMSNYVFAIRNQIPRAQELMNEATVTRALEMFDTGTFKGAVRSSDEKYPVQVRVRDMKWMPPSNAIVNSKIGPIFSLLATKGDIAAMQHDPQVFSLDLGRELDFPNTQECAVSVPFVKADVIHNGNPSENGDQAIVALIDSGIDILHESFLDGNGQSRIEAVWVQRDTSGKTPHQIDATVYQQNYGTLYRANDIQTFVNDDLVNGNNTTPAVLRDPGPTVAQDYGHGTHVASIAAGRAAGTFGGGMAPEARIVVVVPHMKTTPPDPPSLGYSNSHQDALDFLMAYKKARGLPMAVNVSLGMNAGAHDGMSTLEKVFDSVSLKGKEEGFVIVKSAGNERGHRGHVQVQAATAGLVMIEWDSSNIDRTQDYLEFWYATDDEMTFTLIDPSGTRSPTVTHNPAQRKQQFSSGGNDIYLDLTEHHPDNDDNLLTVRIIPVWNPIQQGRWTLEIQAVALGPANGIVNGWVERNDDRPVQFIGSSDDMTLSIPGTADTVIAVAATDTATPLRLHAASSHGPTRRNGAKPDLNAPGDKITAARSNSVDHQAVVTLSGTSMAAPHVTGALALVLSARHKKCLADAGKKQFNAINLAGMLKRSARNYNALHNKGYGYGGLNAAAFFSAADLV